MSSDQSTSWLKTYGKEMPWPSEYLIRIFKGKFPRLNISSSIKPGQKVLDIGCGDGRNIPLFLSLGLDPSGVEISEEILEDAKRKLNGLGIDDVDLRVGFNDKIPYPDEHFDYVVSWNASYYLRDGVEYPKHVEEFYRVLKPHGILILSIPKSNVFLFEESEEVRKGYFRIKKDPFLVRNGMVLRRFEELNEIFDSYRPFFDGFITGAIDDDCFGWEYHWFLVVCKKV